MKQYLFIFLLVIFVSCSKSNEEKAHDNISNYIKSRLDDPKSYDPAEFSPLKTEKEKVNNNPRFIKLYERWKKDSDFELKAYSQFLFTDGERHPDTKKMAQELYNQAKDSSKYSLDQVNKYRNDFKSEDIYVVSHKFRAKNKMGALVLDSCVAYLDKDYNVKYIK